MRFILFAPALALACTLGLAAPEAARAQGPVSISGSATALTDYRFRGLSASHGDPALQGTVTLALDSGPYVGAFASTTGGNPAQAIDRGDAEVDLYAGYATRLPGGFGLDGGLTYYLYPGHAGPRSSNYLESYANLDYSLGPAQARLGAAYAPSGQAALPGRDDSLYLFGELSAGIPLTPLTLRAHVGRTSGALGRVNLDPADHDYVDWSLTAEAAQGPFRAGLSYVDTDLAGTKVALPGGGSRRFDRLAGGGPALIAFVGVGF